MSEALTANQVICQSLTEAAPSIPELLVLTSDSRGSAGMTAFTQQFPKQSIEIGIAEQNLVTIAAGLAHQHKRPFVFSPAAFLSMRSIEQVKVDVSYSQSNVKLIGISGGNSYSNLGSTHHSLQDLAITLALPDLEVYTPCDRFETAALFEYLLHSNRPAYVRVGKRKLPDCYQNPWPDFVPGKGKLLTSGSDVALITAGETVTEALDASKQLAKIGIHATVVDLVSIKPLDTQLIQTLCAQFDHLITIEEHSKINGIGAQVASIVATQRHAILTSLAFPDQPAISGTQAEVFHEYGIDAHGITQSVQRVLNE